MLQEVLHPDHFFCNVTSFVVTVVYMPGNAKVSVWVAVMLRVLQSMETVPLNVVGIFPKKLTVSEKLLSSQVSEELSGAPG